MVAAAAGAAQHLEVTPERAVSVGVGGAEDADDGTAQGAGEMERARVAGDGEGYAPGDGDQLAKRAVEGRGRTGSGLSDGVGEGLFAGPDIDYDAVAAGDKVNRDGCITLCGPTLCAIPLQD